MRWEDRPGLTDYGAIRGEVQDGDVFLFQGTYLISRMFRYVNRSFYSHVGFAAWWGDRLMLMQSATKGVQAVPLSVAADEYSGRVDWFSLERTGIEDLDVRLGCILSEARLDLGLNYGVGALLRNIAHALWRTVLLDPQHPRAMFCSQYVSHCFRKGGLPVTDRPDIETWPKDFEASPLFRYRATLRHTGRGKATPVWERSGSPCAEVWQPDRAAPTTVA